MPEWLRNWRIRRLRERLASLDAQLKFARAICSGEHYASDNEALMTLAGKKAKIEQRLEAAQAAGGEKCQE